MTAALGRLPTVQAGAWVWDDVRVRVHAPLSLQAGTLETCVQKAEGPTGRVVASMVVPRCVGLHGLARAAAPG
jgi:hypothetical protein